MAVLVELVARLLIGVASIKYTLTIHVRETEFFLQGRLIRVDYSILGQHVVMV